MRQYLIKLETCNYLPQNSTPTHGFDGWLQVSQMDPSWATNYSDAVFLAEATGNATG